MAKYSYEFKLKSHFSDKLFNKNKTLNLAQKHICLYYINRQEHICVLFL